MLRVKFCLDFASTPIMHTIWPWAFGFSVLQGVLHFALKAYCDPAKSLLDLDMWLLIVRKFLLPGTIFFSFLWRYGDIHNTLMPLNRVVEEDYTQKEQHCPWLSKLQAMNERILSFDARHRDVVGSAAAKVGKAPTIADIVQNIVDNYDNAREIWSGRIHRDWGLFRSMWPASVLLDPRLDRNDPETREWLSVFAILVSACIATSSVSLYLLFFIDQVKSFETETSLANFVLGCHGLLIVVFIFRTLRSMFYYRINILRKLYWGTE
jgi:hypothetical protein